ncbi:MAG: hypothetical protein ACI8XV_001803 [Arenicella sp.]|jgi:hypothetical protein
MNRIVESMGVALNAAILEKSKKRMATDLDNSTPYRNFSEILKKG